MRSGWCRDTAGISGDAAVAWLGPCAVPTVHLVDCEDAAAGAHIAARQMLHVIVEVHEKDLERAVLRQRLLVSMLAELLRGAFGAPVQRDGDDLFVNGRKLTVSIATNSPVSTLVHLGINVDAAGAPVPAIGLNELGISPRRLAERLLEWLAREHAGVRRACRKVRPVE